MKTIRLFSSDLDGTLAGDPRASRAFADFWSALDPASRPVLVYNSGRLVDDMATFIVEERLPQPDFFIRGVGTMLSSSSHGHLADRFSAAVGRGYDVAAVERILSQFPGVTRQPDRYQHAYKSSWFLHDAGGTELVALEAALAEAGLSATIVYSSGRDLDIIPDQADKGSALTWLCAELGVGLDEVVVAGDTGNDRGMFTLRGVRGIVPANGLAELRALGMRMPNVYMAGSEMAAGVIEGLRHWQVGTA